MKKGKGCHLLPLIKALLQSKENWKMVTDKKKTNYQYLGTFASPSKNFLWYVDDVTTLPHYTESDPDFMWLDVQFSKQSPTRQLISVDIGNGEEKLVFLWSQCQGVKSIKSVTILFQILQYETCALTIPVHH